VRREARPGVLPRGAAAGGVAVPAGGAAGGAACPAMAGAGGGAAAGPSLGPPRNAGAAGTTAAGRAPLARVLWVRRVSAQRARQLPRAPERARAPGVSVGAGAGAVAVAVATEAGAAAWMAGAEAAVGVGDGAASGPSSARARSSRVSSRGEELSRPAATCEVELVAGTIEGPDLPRSSLRTSSAVIARPGAGCGASTSPGAPAAAALSIRGFSSADASRTPVLPLVIVRKVSLCAFRMRDSPSSAATRSSREPPDPDSDGPSGATVFVAPCSRAGTDSPFSGCAGTTSSRRPAVAASAATSSGVDECGVVASFGDAAARETGPPGGGSSAGCAQRVGVGIAVSAGSLACQISLSPTRTKAPHCFGCGYLPARSSSFDSRNARPLSSPRRSQRS
jgi:hypothetical protein